MALVFAYPGRVARTVRWSMRSPARAVAFLCLLYVLHSWLVVSGIMEAIRDAKGQLVATYVSAREHAEATSEYLMDWFTWAEGWYALASGVMPVWRWISVLLALCVVICVWNTDADDTSSAGSSRTGSSATSEKPVDEVSVEGKRILADLVKSAEHTATSISDLVASQKAMREELEDFRTAQRAKEIHEEVLRPPAAPGGDLKPMRDRLEGFERMLKEHVAKPDVEAPAEEGRTRVPKSSSTGDLGLTADGADPP